MKIKKWHLFAVIITLFCVSFFVINLKFDKFYRLNGINNDNRVIIEEYLDEKEQVYLVEKQIDIDQFIRFIKYDDFHLENYQYYNLLDKYTDYSHTKIISVGNNLVARLEFLFNTNAYSHAEQLVKNSLEQAFLHDENFDFQYINIYKNLKDIYGKNDYSYIDDTIIYINKLKLYGITEQKDIEDKFEQLSKSYNQSSLKVLMSKPYDANVGIVYNPYEFTTIVNDYTYIGEYSPRELILTQDIPRVKYSMYLQKDAYSALIKMYQALNEKYDRFLLVDAYTSPEALKKDNKKVGYCEEQLGLTICVSQRELAYKQFDETEMSKWLQQHAHEYGFVLRYPKRKASVTNHSYDAHMYRYVGKSLAKTLYESQLTLEEYTEQKKL